MKESFNNQILTLLSFAGLIFLIFFFQLAPSSGINKQLVLFLFILICILGMMAAAYPQRCLSFMKMKSSGDSKSTGHHPECEIYQNHTFTLNGRKYCIGCSGLFCGAVVGIILCSLYLVEMINSPQFFSVGIMLVYLSLLQLSFVKLDNKIIKFSSNFGLVLGSTLLLLGILEYKANLASYFLVLTCLWIYTRMTTSAEDHTRICNACPETESCPHK